MKLVVLDGPEYRARGLIRRRDAILVDPARRDEDSPATAASQARAYARRRGAARRRRLEPGALALLHQHWTRPGPLAGLLLQSGSFFHRDTERYERGFTRFDQVHRFVDRVLAGRRPPPRIPVTMTCGLAEQNLDNNRPVAEALAAHGWDVRLVEHPGGHDWDAWRPTLCARSCRGSRARRARRGRHPTWSGT